MRRHSFLSGASDLGAKLIRACFIGVTAGACFYVASALAQNDSGSGLDSIQIPQQRLPLCFGFTGISNDNALAVCDALDLNENVRARELAEQWIAREPDNPGAQFALAEVLFTVEGNLPRALFHLNRAEELTSFGSLDAAIASGNVEWHYLTLSQLSYVHQLMGNQEQSLAYLDKIRDIYGQDVESFRGWPLIKLKRYDDARRSANRVLETSSSESARARAWNTLCAVELASLAPVESMGACERAISEDEELSEDATASDTVYLTNASEVALSLLQMTRAEEYIDRATRYLNPDSVADPWVFKLYLTMNQGRFDEARQAMERMLIWRQQQEPVVTVMNRAEHFLVSAAFLLLAGYTEDAVKLTTTALNQPDRNGSYSADDAQKDSYAALLNMMANRIAYEKRREVLATRGRVATAAAQFELLRFRLNAWQAERRAAALFASFDVLQNRLRPYAPLDVHIPEWVEPEIIGIVGSGVMSKLLEQARENGAFQLNDGYYHAYQTEIAALESSPGRVLESGRQALSLLPAQEVLLRARVASRMAAAAWRREDNELAAGLIRQALSQDPSVPRRLGLSLPVSFSHDGSELALEASRYLSRSPRFHRGDSGLTVSLQSQPTISACLEAEPSSNLACYTLDQSEITADEDAAQALARLFQERIFGLGFEISKAQRSMLLGSSVILRSQGRTDAQGQNPFLIR